MLNKANLLCSEFTSNVKARSGLCCVVVEPDKTVAADGSILAVVSRPKKENQPLPEIPEGLKEVADRFFLRQDVIKRIRLPKFNKNHKYLEVVIPCSNGKDNVIVLSTQEMLGASNLQEMVRDDDVSFPDYSQVIPKEEAAFRVKFNIDYIEKICRLMKSVAKEGNNIVEISYYKPMSPVKFKTVNPDVQQAEVYLMPIEES